MSAFYVLFDPKSTAEPVLHSLGEWKQSLWHNIFTSLVMVKHAIGHKAVNVGMPDPEVAECLGCSDNARTEMVGGE
jgi:hypothetical protein